MKKILTAAVIIILCGGFSLFAKNTTLNEAQSMLNTKSIEFIENKGQIADQNGNVNHDVLFIAEVPYGTVTIRRDGISCSFIKRDEEKLKAQSDKMLSKERFDKKSEFEDEAIPTEIYRVDMRLKGSNFNPNFEQFEMTEDYNNYYLAHCPDGITHVRKFKTVKLSDVYPNIDFVVYANNDGLVQYDFVVKPGANPNLINFVFEGAKDVEITADGTLKVETPFGNIEQKAPVAYQPYNLNEYLNSRDFSPQSPAPSPQTHFTKNSNNTISFNIANYDQSKPLIIDPPTRLWGTYYGGSDYDYGSSVVTDVSGYVYLAGRTTSSDAIATAGSHQNSLGGYYDAFLVKFNNNGVREWGTYYGGSNDDVGYSVATDVSGYVCLAGWTRSNNAIATAGSHQSSFGGGELLYDAFLVKFNSSGIREWGTYYGGSNDDIGYSVATDVSGYIYLTGRTTSSNAIATASSHQSSFGGWYDAFLVKFNSNGVREWGTYYGVSGIDYGTSVATDGLGYVYLSGTTSSNAIATAGSHQSAIGGDVDAFLVKFNSIGVREWGTYYGGSDDDNGLSVATDGLGYVYLTGTTNSSNAIATAGSHQSSFGGGDWDAFLVKFNSSGIREWGTYYGGNGTDEGLSVATDGSDYVYLSGLTVSSDSIATADSHQSSFGGASDAFLVKFNSNGVREWGTYYGGSSVDDGYSVAIDGSGYVYLAGETGSSNAIATAGSHQSSIGGGWAAFLVKFESEQSITEIEIPLISGWNLISSNVLPLETAMVTIFNETENLVIVKNNLGNIYSPLFGINEIGNWDISQGYYVYVTSSSILQIEGILVNPVETSINLNQGWNLISYLRNSEMLAPDALQSITGSMLFAKDRMGNIYHPGYGINNIGNMQVGQGYWIYMNAPAVLTYPGN